VLSNNAWALNQGSYGGGFAAADKRIDDYYHNERPRKKRKRKHNAKNHYYIQLSKPTIYDSIVIQSELKPYGCLLTCCGEFKEYDIDRYKLVYLGCGHRDDKHIQDKIEEYNYGTR